MERPHSACAVFHDVADGATLLAVNSSRRMEET
jgi:hypothetical protein